MWKKRIELLIQSFLFLSSCLKAACGYHSLTFLSSGLVRPGDHPLAEQLTVYDGVPISHCDGPAEEEKLKQSLQSNNLPQHCVDAIVDILNSLYVIPKSINSTVYIVQRWRGCIQSTDGTVSAFETWAVNGDDFLNFDPGLKKWSSLSPSAKAVEHLWNNEKARNSVYSNFIIYQCPQMIKGINLRSIHQETDLQVFGKSTASPEQALLICHVTSTDTSVRSVHLTGNGDCRASQIKVPGPVPSGDGSVIIRLTARISLKNSNTCSCTVQADGRDITVFWDGYTLDGRYLLYHTVNWLALIGKIGVSLVFLTLIVIFVVFAVKKKSRRTPKVDPQLIAQFTRMNESLTNPEVQSVMVSFLQGTKINREYEERWEVWIKSKDQNCYDRDFYGGHVEGP